MTPSPGPRPASHLAVFGVTQSGKTLWLRRVLAQKPRWIALDLDDEYGPAAAVAGEPHLSGVQVVRGVDRLAEAIRARAGSRPDRWRISYRATGPDAYLAGLRAMWSLHRHLELRTTLVVVEEAHRLLEGHNLPHAYRQLLFRGLKRRLVAVTVSQNVQQVPAQVRQMTDRQVYFRIVGRVPRDVRDNLGDQADRLADLEPLTPAYQARRGVHYVFHPAHLDDRAEIENL